MFTIIKTVNMIVIQFWRHLIGLVKGDQSVKLTLQLYLCALLTYEYVLNTT